ncbi:MAG: hypothetical protein O2894_04385 [Planctomycetota bacterium]|nr:hypothetical protein [Planctomycetota bacterium]
MTIRNLLIASLVLCIAGCGCNDDSTPPGGVAPQAIPAVLGIKTQLPPIPVVPPPPLVEPIKIDVVFVLDDGDQMINSNLGIIPANPADRRKRMQAAQAIFRNLQANATTRFNQEWLAQHPGTTPPPLDFAFAVTRYEDFGGPFTSAFRRQGNVDDPLNKNNDQDARPFILNMPILREAHPQFATLFDNAMSREAPGDGNPFVLVGPELVRAVDPQSGIEALWQIAAPTQGNGNIGGFDADKNGNTQGSGQPTSLNPARNPQTLPGASGDVPAVRYLANGVDGDGEPLFTVADETGAAVTVPNPAGGTFPSPASGNIGQVGWRPDAARFAILASSMATVAPTETTPQGTPEFPGVLPPPADSEMVTSSAGAPDAPREARSVLLGSFDGGPLVLQGGTPITKRRTGVPDDNEIAPTGAHTVQETINRLNALDIEILFLGTPVLGGLDTKPGVTGVNGDIDSDIEGDKFDPTDATKVQPDFAPWFWMNGTGTLTTPPVTSIPPGGRVTPAVFGGNSNLFWGTYNMGTVWPFNPADPTGTNEATIRPVVGDDLAERIVAWIDGGYVAGGTTPAPRPPLPTVSYEIALELLNQELPNGDVIQVSPLEGGFPKGLFTQVVQVPTYWSDDLVIPAPVVVSFPLPADGPFQYTEANDMVALPASRTVPFEMRARFDSMGNMLPANLDQQMQITTFIKVRGDGFNVDGGGNMIPLPSEFTEIIQALGSYTVTVRDSLFPGPGAQIGLVSRGCAIINDLTAGQNSADQVGGTCPWPTNP